MHNAMNSIITFTDNIIGAIVAKDAHKIKIREYFDGTQYLDLDLSQPIFYINLPSGKWEIVCEFYDHEARYYGRHSLPINFHLMPLDYCKKLLISKDIYWVNPDPEPELRNYLFQGTGMNNGVTFSQNGYDIEKYNADLSEWQRKQSNAEEMKGNKVVICAKID